MASGIFNEQMTSTQAGYAFFSAIKGNMSAEEKEKIKAEYEEISRKILKRELELAGKGWLIG